MIKAQVGTPTEALLDTGPSRDILGRQGLVIDDGTVKPASDGLFLLPVKSHSHSPVQLVKNEVIGMLAPTTIENQDKDTESHRI